MILVTGGAGFIGANFVLDWLAASDESILNLDKLTYAGNLENLASLKNDARHRFVRGDIGDAGLVAQLLAEHQPRAVVNFAAESHVDRSIHGPGEFIQTNIVGTFHLLEAVRAIGVRCLPMKRPASASSMCRLTRFMARSKRMIRPLPKRILISPTALIQRRKRPPIIWCAPTITPTAYRS